MRSAVLVTVVALSVAVAASPSAAPDRGVAISLELNQEFYYEGDPLPVRISIRNDSEESVANPVKKPLFQGFRVRVPRTPDFAPAEKPKVKEPSRPGSLAPNAFYGATVDLTEIYPQLRAAGTYEIEWSAGDLRSPRLTIKVIASYDPARLYEGRIETSHGSMKLHFFPQQAPVAVKAFIDMANAGFYDGLLFHEVRPDEFVVAGAARNQKMFLYPAERTRLPLVAGTVVVKPVGATPPTNGAEFITLLRPQPAWAGQVTVLGQIVDGLDVVRKISLVPNGGPTSRPPFRPLDEVRIRRIEIHERPAQASAP